MCKYCRSSRSKTNFSNFANPYAVVTAPFKPNNNEYVPLASVDTNDWSLDSNDSTKLICNNSGVWQIVAQYQLYNKNSLTYEDVSNLSGWYAINGINLANSDASQSTGFNNLRSVLTIAVTQYISCGDFVQFGIRGSSSNAVIQSFLDSSGIFAPSLIITAIRVSP